MTRWIDALDSKLGALGPVARQFATTALTSPVPRGAAALTALTVSVEGWLHADADSPPEHEFSEGAGAFLGAIFVDALRGIHASDAGKHRIRFPSHGFVDPFAAIQATLDSPSPRAELARWVRQAEAEANGTGPLARIVQMLLRKLPTDDGFRLVHHFEHDLRFACGIELSIARAVRATEDLEAHAAESAVDKLISLVTAQSAPLPLPWEQIQGDVFPRLVPSTFVDELARRSEQTRSILVSPFPNDLRLAFVLRRGDRARFIRTDELGTWGVRHVELLEAAVANLAAASTKASFSEVMTTDGPLVVARSGDGLDAARLLLPGLHAVLSNHLGGDIAVAVPHRDALYAVDASNTPLVHQLRRKAEDDARRAPHRITTDLFRVGKSRLEPLAIRAS